MSLDGLSRVTEPLERERVAIRTQQRFASRRAPVLLEGIALRRPEIVVRRTRYVGVVVDERVLTRAFAPRRVSGRLQAFMMVRGSLHVGSTAELGPGDTLVLRPDHQALLRLDNAEFVEIEWNSGQDVPAPIPIHGKTDAREVFAAYDDPGLSQRELLAGSIALFRRAGAPLGAHDAALLEGAPSERDERIAQAIASQLGTIGTTADTLVLGELAGVSPRQLQRIYARLCATYGMHLASWRDTRNRWRLQTAAVLLSRADLSLADIAVETGYRSTQAMARSFLRAGLPSPSEVRRSGADATFRRHDLAGTGSISDAEASPASGLRRMTP